MYETTSQQSIDFDVHELLHDGYIGSSLDPIKVIEKTLKKINKYILRLLLIILQTYEIKAKVEVLVKRSEALKLSYRTLNHNINSFRNL